MELTIVAPVGNMRLQRRIDPVGHGVGHLILVRQRHGDVIDLQSDQGSSGVGYAANVRTVLGQSDEIDDDVEFGKSCFAFVVDGSDIFGRDSLETLSSKVPSGW